MLLKAKDDFYVDLVDGDGFVTEEDGFRVTKDSLWYIEDVDVKDYLNGGEVYLYEQGSSRYLIDVSLDGFGSMFEQQ